VKQNILKDKHRGSHFFVQENQLSERYPSSALFEGEAIYQLRLQSNVNVQVKVKFTQEQATKAQRGSRGIALFFH
jgi:hypothetical protein